MPRWKPVDCSRLIDLAILKKRRETASKGYPGEHRTICRLFYIMAIEISRAFYENQTLQTWWPKNHDINGRITGKREDKRKGPVLSEAKHPATVSHPSKENVCGGRHVGSPFVVCRVWSIQAASARSGV
jgi:hypothetical protein